MTGAGDVHEGVLYNATHVVLPFVEKHIAHLGPRGLGRDLRQVHALGVVRGGRLIGGVVYGGWKDFDCEVSLAFEDPRWARRRILERLFAYPFDQLGCRRITAITADDDARVLKLMRGIGWTLEGRHRRGLDGTRDALSWGMCAEDCRFLPPPALLPDREASDVQEGR